MTYGAKLNLTAGRFNEPEYRKKSADSCGPCYRAHIRGLGQRGPADIGRKPDTVAVVRGEILKIISRCANPELAGVREDGRSHKDCESDAHYPEPHLSTSVKSGNRTKMRGRPARKIEHHFIDVTPAPSFRRIIGLDDRVPGCGKMFCCVPIWRLIAATDMAAGATDPQMQPGVTRFQAFLTPRRARNDIADC